MLSRKFVSEILKLRICLKTWSLWDYLGGLIDNTDIAFISIVFAL